MGRLTKFQLTNPSRWGDTPAQRRRACMSRFSSATMDSYVDDADTDAVTSSASASASSPAPNKPRTLHAVAVAHDDDPEAVDAGGDSGHGNGAGSAETDIPTTIDTEFGHAVVLEERLDMAYEPSEEEVAEYARLLGMDPVHDAGLLHIARDGLKEPLPVEWKPCRTVDGPPDSPGSIFFFNFATGQSSWAHPADAKYEAMFRAEKEKRSRPRELIMPPVSSEAETAATLGNGSGTGNGSGNGNANEIDVGGEDDVAALSSSTTSAAARSPASLRGLGTPGSTPPAPGPLSRKAAPGAQFALKAMGKRPAELDTAKAAASAPASTPPPASSASTGTTAAATTSTAELRRIQEQIEELRRSITTSKRDAEEAWSRAEAADDARARAEATADRLRAELRAVRAESDRRRAASRRELEELANRLAAAENARDTAERRVRELLLRESARIRRVERDVESLGARLARMSPMRPGGGVGGGAVHVPLTATATAMGMARSASPRVAAPTSSSRGALPAKSPFAPFSVDATMTSTPPAALARKRIAASSAGGGMLTAAARSASRRDPRFSDDIS